MHIQAKQKLVEWQGCYQFALRTCKICRAKVKEDCRNGQMKIEARSTDKRWRYDVLLTREDQSMLAMEVYHTHSTGDKKVMSSAILGVQIAEFDADDILNLKKGGWLDNKRDASWICSPQCKHRQDMELKRLADMELKRLAEARLQAHKQEQLKRQQAMEEIQREKDAKQREKEEEKLREEARCREKEAESQKMENELRQIALHKEAAEERWRQAAEKHREACAIKNAKKKKKTKPTPTTIKPQPQPHSPPPVIVKRRKT